MIDAVLGRLQTAGDPTLLDIERQTGRHVDVHLPVFPIPLREKHVVISRKTLEKASCDG